MPVTSLTTCPILSASRICRMANLFVYRQISGYKDLFPARFCFRPEREISGLILCHGTRTPIFELIEKESVFGPIYVSKDQYYSTPNNDGQAFSRLAAHLKVAGVPHDHRRVDGVLNRQSILPPDWIAAALWNCVEVRFGGSSRR